MKSPLEKSLRGKVVKIPFGEGSKSAHAAVCLQTPEGKAYRLRLPGGNAFSDPKLEALVGQDITVKGELVHGTTLLVSTWAPEKAVLPPKRSRKKPG